MKQEQLERDIQPIAGRWKDKPGSLIMILHEIEDLYGYVPREASLVISKLCSIPLARIYEVLTFYHYFRLQPPGKWTISVCMGTACYLKGATEILQEIKSIIGVEEGETSSDGIFNLRVVRCLGCCGLAPVIKVGEKIYGEVRKQEIMNILSAYTRPGKS